MKLIPLTKNQFAMVDDEDYDFLMQWKWQAKKVRDVYYVNRTTSEKVEGKKCKHVCLSMHRVIMKCIGGDGKMIDHKDRNPLNNQKSNLRFCTRSENQKNKKAQGASKYLGVTLHITLYKKQKSLLGETKFGIHSRWVSRIKVEGRQISLGRFKNEEEAAICYDAAAKKYHGEFARLNFK